jgi:hypothetical protein
MVYNITTVVESAEPLVGFESNDGFTLPEALTETTLKLNHYHPFLSLDILDNVRPESQQLEDWLISVRKSSITSLLNDVISKKLSTSTIKSVLSDTRVFDSTARFSNLVPKNDRLVGWILRPSKARYLQHIIKNIGIQLIENQELVVHLFHSSMKDPVAYYTLNVTNAPSVQWFRLVDIIDPLPLNYEDYDAGGFYFVGYYESDLTTNNRAIYKDYDLSVAPCGTCNAFNIKAYRSWSKYLSISTGYYRNQDLVDRTLPSVEDLQVDNDMNYGLNFHIESYCDITKFLTENISILAPSLQVRYAIDLLRYIEMSGLRKNSITDSMKEESFVAINGQKSENNFIKVKGLIHTYEEYVKGLNFDMSLMDAVCLPSSKTGITFR